MSKLPDVANAHRRLYPSDLSDAEWSLINPLLLLPKGFGHPVEVDFREILNAIFYVQRTGCQWEMMPHDLPPHTTVYGYFRKWQRKGLREKMHDQLRQKVRQKDNRHPTSTIAIADSQSVKTTKKRGRSVVSTVAKRLRTVSDI